MSTIVIKEADIVTIGTDAVVNAANEAFGKAAEYAEQSLQQQDQENLLLFINDVLLVPLCYKDCKCTNVKCRNNKE